MKINHPAVKSDVFKLVSTFEFDLSIGEHFLPTRVELFQDTERKRRFRCRLWERELYHMQMTLPADPKRKSRPPATDEEILVERTWEVSSRFDDFEADDEAAALKMFLDTLKQYLNRLG